MNKRGVNLLELMVCLVILGIITQVMTALFVQAAKSQKKLQAAITQAQNTTIQTNTSGLTHVSMTTASTGTPLICFDDSKADGCSDCHRCQFLGGKWMRDKKDCDSGVLLLK